jgi:hypothetical protein
MLCVRTHHTNNPSTATTRPLICCGHSIPHASLRVPNAALRLGARGSFLIPSRPRHTDEPQQQKPVCALQGHEPWRWWPWRSWPAAAPRSGGVRGHMPQRYVQLVCAQMEEGGGGYITCGSRSYSSEARRTYSRLCPGCAALWRRYVDHAERVERVAEGLHLHARRRPVRLPLPPVWSWSCHNNVVARTTLFGARHFVFYLFWRLWIGRAELLGQSITP